MKPFNIQTYRNLIDTSGGATRENLFILLGRVQDAFGYVPDEAVSDLARRTGIAEARIYGALTAYRDFKIGSKANG